MPKRLCALLCCLFLLLSSAALAENPQDWELEEDEELSGGLLDELPDLDGWLGDAGDELEPLSEEELLQILAEEADDRFVLLPEDFTMADEDVFTLLLIGSDSYSNDKRGRSDTTILMRIDAEHKTIRMVSFLRDMYLAIPGKGSNRLNASYIWGGERLLRKTLEKNFGVTADAYIEVNFQRLIRLIDAIGGVELEVSAEEQRQVNSILRYYNTYTGDPEEDQLLEESGLVRLTGKQALSYARIRKIDGDYQRTARQRKVIEAAFRQVMELDFAGITQLISENLDAVTTDLSVQDVVRLIPLAIRCKNASIETLTIPAAGTWQSATRNGMAVIVPDLKKNRTLLKEFLMGEGT